jgi:hypothetical protein
MGRQPSRGDDRCLDSGACASLRTGSDTDHLRGDGGFRARRIGQFGAVRYGHAAGPVAVARVGLCRAGLPAARDRDRARRACACQLRRFPGRAGRTTSAAGPRVPSSVGSSLSAAYGTSLRVEPKNRDAVHFVTNLLDESVAEHDRPALMTRRSLVHIRPPKPKKPKD